MTCIVAICQDGKVFMGGDSGASDAESGSIATVSSPKVFVKDEYIIGYAGNFRFGKFMQYAVELPKVPSWAKGDKIDEFVNGIFIASIRKQIAEMALEEKEKDFGLLIGLRGRVFELGDNYAAVEMSRGYNATGSGAEVATGSLYTTETWKDPIKRIKTALTASAEFNAFVRPPFTIVEV